MQGFRAYYQLFLFSVPFLVSGTSDGVEQELLWVQDGASAGQEEDADEPSGQFGLIAIVICVALIPLVAFGLILACCMSRKIDDDEGQDSEAVETRTSRSAFNPSSFPENEHYGLFSWDTMGLSTYYVFPEFSFDYSVFGMGGLLLGSRGRAGLATQKEVKAVKTTSTRNGIDLNEQMTDHTDDNDNGSGEFGV